MNEHQTDRIDVLLQTHGIDVSRTGSISTRSLPLCYAAENRISSADSPAEYKRAVSPAQLKPVFVFPAKTVLLVEESEPAVIELKDILEESGDRILIAPDDGEALGIIADTVPDAMILDLMMPGINGLEVLRTNREAERTAQIPVRILTASAMGSDRATVLPHGFDAYIATPIDERQFLRIIHEVLYGN